MMPSFQTKNNFYLHVKLKSNLNNENEIYDYRAQAKKEIEATIKEDLYITRAENNNFKMKHQQAEIENNENFIFRVQNKRKNKYKIVNFIPKSLKYQEDNVNYLLNKIWYVLKSNEKKSDEQYNEEEYFLNVNDVLRLGRIIFIVQKISIGQKDQQLSDECAPVPVLNINYNISNLNKNKEPVFNLVYNVTKYSNYLNFNQKIENNTPYLEDVKECEFCNDNQNQDYDEEIKENENFLMCLCKCQDKMIHYQCIKRHLKELIKSNNKNNDDDNVESIIIKNFVCSKCNTPYPIRFTLPNEDTVYNLVDIKEPNNCDFMILETLDNLQNKEYFKAIYIIKLRDNITIGRDHDNSIVLNDVSISKKHAIFTYNWEEGSISVRDRNSKFGTLVLVRSPIKILKTKLFLQVGRTFIEASKEEELNGAKMEQFDEDKKENENIKKDTLNIQEKNRNKTYEDTKLC